MDGGYVAAAEEFQRAYDLSSNDKVFYSLGRAVYATGDAGAASAFFRRYLDAGGASVPEERRREVEELIEDIDQTLDGGRGSSR